jgi:hypothetical protein
MHSRDSSFCFTIKQKAPFARFLKQAQTAAFVGVVLSDRILITPVASLTGFSSLTQAIIRVGAQ